ncbi:sulfatase [Sedimentisphaera salicampi]|uniref:Arylsulfatase n=1 Tax=Sedimentisphaera salicampi TaxID=1941349 RepID=A0A1W6LKB7_9BACT|nr:sulfatase-like hydrolase/transferase [Sedimentisphaera salicampi]ARN56183.1 Arylsulfatase precursor [Sedimentisphaera salicampi]
MQSRRYFLKSAGIMVAGAVGTIGNAGCSASRMAIAGAEKKTKPNVIILLIDDLGYGDVGAFGCEDIPTPNMDRLAERGVKCTNSYVTNPPCSPSRCSLMMGMYAQRFGKYGMARGLPLPENKPTLAEYMRDAGYATGMVGKWDIGSPEQPPMKCGFMEVAKIPPTEGKNRYICINQDGSKGWRTDIEGDMMTDFIARHKNEPFFLYFSPQAVHSPSSEVPEELRKRSKASGKRRALAGNIISVDDQVGKLLTALEKYGLKKDTLIFLTGDNGPNLYEGGSSDPYRGGKGYGTQQEGWVHTPTIISHPGTIPQNSFYEGLMCTLDFYATTAAAADIPIPTHCDGVDLIPYLKRPDLGDAHPFLFWLNKDPTDPKHRHLTAVRWKKWRLYKHKNLGWQLFDLERDPKEKNDLADKHPEIVRKMASKHAEWAKTLAPVKTASANGLPQDTGGKVPVGYGWTYAVEINNKV